MLECLSTYFLSLLPEGFDPNDLFWSMVFIFAIVAFAAVVIKFIFKTAAAYLHALSSAMAILFFYLFNILLYPLLPDIFGRALDLLPLVELGEESVALYHFSFSLENFPAICSQFLHILIFSLILITLDDLIPDAKNTPSWIILQFAIVCLTAILYSVLLEFMEMLPQDILTDYAPVILVGVLLTFVFLGVLKIIFTLMLVSVSPLLGAIGAWFSGSRFGQILGKGVLCAALVCIISEFLAWRGMTTVVFAEASPLIYSLYMILLLVLWVFTGHFL